MFGRDLVLDFVVADDAALLHVHEEHAARLQAPLVRDPLRRDRQHAGFRCHDDEVVLRHVITRWAQSVAVQRRADHRAISESDGRGSIPRLHQARVVFVKRLLRVAHRLVPGPRLRDHHHHGVRQRAPAHHEQFQHVVEHRGVRSVRIHDRQDLLDVVAKERAREQGFPRLHPVDVSAQRVDFAVVRDVAVRVRPLPTRESVRGEPRMHQRQRTLHVRVLKIGEILPDLHGHQHSFIHDRPRRQTRRIPELIDARPADRLVRPFADHVKFQLERLRARHRRSAFQENLAHERLRTFRRVADHRVIRRNIAPSEHLLPFLLRDLLEDARALCPLLRVG
jgi:hypothetical protein